MAGPQPAYAQRKLARRAGGSDISRLAQSYQGQLNDLTNQYETQYSTYQKMVADTMVPFEAASARYNQGLDDYATNVVNPYKLALDQFSKTSEAYLSERAQIDSGARDRFSSSYEYSYRVGRQEYGGVRINDPFTGQAYEIGGDFRTNPEAYGLEYVLTPVEGGYRGQNKYTFRPLATSPVPVSPEKPADFAMQKPELPVIDEFDQGQFDAKRGELDQGFKREIGERRSAKINAVSRRRSRPLMAGVNQG